MVDFGELCVRVESFTEKWDKALNPKIQKYHPVSLRHNKNLRSLHTRLTHKLPINANKTKQQAYLPLPRTNPMPTTITNFPNI